MTRQGVTLGLYSIIAHSANRSPDLSATQGTPIHMVSAFAARQRMVLAQVKVAEKANEIVAIPILLDMLAIEGAIVTVDAMGCQRNIAQKIVKKRPITCSRSKAIRAACARMSSCSPPSRRPATSRTRRSAGIRRLMAIMAASKPETYTVIHDVAWLQQRHNWPGLRSVVMVESTREIGGKVEQETRFYITSLVWLASQLGPVIRSHWVIENSLHWVLDMIFRDDDCRVRTANAPANFLPSNTWPTT